MIQIAPTLTDAGISLLIRGASGEKITFTKFKIGNGELQNGSSADSLTDIINPILPVGISSVDASEEGYYQLTGTFDNGDIASDFRWRELGVFCAGEKTAKFSGDGTKTTFTLADKPKAVHYCKVNGSQVTVSGYAAETGVVTLTSAPASGTNNVVFSYPDPSETLYAYCNDSENAGILKANSSNVLVQNTITVIVAIGTASNVTALISANSLYAGKSEFDAHVSNRNNPHGVSKGQIGLDQVENVSVNNQAPTYTVPNGTSTQALVSGETMATAFGKISRAILNFMSHVQNKSNPHSVTAAQVGAAKSTHNHNAADINGGVLSVARGGTGVSNVDELRSFFGSGIVVGNYTGNNGVKRLINLGFQPTAVLLTNGRGMTGDDIDGICGGLALRGFGLRSRNCTDQSHERTWNDTHTAMMIADNGFWVNFNTGSKVATNKSGETYRYIAWR